MERIDQLAALIAELSDGDGARGTAVPGLCPARMSTTCAPRNTVDRVVLWTCWTR